MVVLTVVVTGVAAAGAASGGGGGLLALALILAGAAWWLWPIVTNYSELAVPYYYFAWFFYHILILPTEFIIPWGGEIFSFLRNGLTPWGNMNLVIALIVSGVYWILVAVVGLLSLSVYVPLALLSGLLIAMWVGLRWLFS